MKASELRIGNYVNIFLNDVDYNTIQIKVDDLYYILQKNGVYEPIPLTEEWLLKFGFENIDKGDNDFITYTDSEHNYYLQIDVRRKDGKYLILDNSFDDLRAFSMVDIEYVHQLQNLYFALYGIDIQCN
jgi:hypothetical protein